MRRLALSLTGLLIAASVLAADLVITSFQRNGSLTWTNSLTNGTYQVQWSNSSTGQWTNFQALTKLDSVQATGELLTVKVPMFYRVATQPTASIDVEGVYQYEGFNAEGDPLIVGWLYVGPAPHPDDVRSGTWALGYVGDPTCADPRLLIGKQIGKGELQGALVNGKLRINLTPNIGNYIIGLDGTLQSGSYTGIWAWTTFQQLQTNGTFSALKLSDCSK